MDADVDGVAEDDGDGDDDGERQTISFRLKFLVLVDSAAAILRQKKPAKLHILSGTRDSGFATA